jgi:TPR repeat protein
MRARLCYVDTQYEINLLLWKLANPTMTNAMQADLTQLHRSGSRVLCRLLLAVSLTAFTCPSTAQPFRSASDWATLTEDAVLGDRNKQFELALRYEYQGGPSNLIKAIYWYQEAAKNGHPVAQNNLGVLYNDGRGVERNFSEAVKWFSESATQGNSDAQYNLGLKYLRGEGVTQSDVEAYKWWLLASNSNDKARRAKEVLARRMSDSELVEAQKRATDIRLTTTK